MAHTHTNHNHQHGLGCGHTGVKHGDHCDDHGPVNVVE